MGSKIHFTNTEVFLFLSSKPFPVDDAAFNISIINLVYDFYIIISSRYTSKNISFKVVFLFVVLLTKYYKIWKKTLFK